MVVGIILHIDITVGVQRVVLSYHAIGIRSVHIIMSAITDAPFVSCECTGYFVVFIFEFADFRVDIGRVADTRMQGCICRI